MSGVVGSSDGAFESAFIEIVVESWRLTRTFARVLAKLDAGDAARFQNQLRFFQKRLEETLARTGLKLVNLEGQPYDTKYQPLRDRVTKELGIAGSTDVDPMTAVAEGAALFAESIEWSSASRGRKSARGTLTAQSHLLVALQFLARTPDTKAKVVLKVGKPTAFFSPALDRLILAVRAVSSGQASVRVYRPTS